MPVNVRDNTFQRTFCPDVRQSEPLSSVHLRRHADQRTVSTDGPRVSLFFKRQSSWRITVSTQLAASLATAI